jgi:hypothetical protein
VISDVVVYVPEAAAEGKVQEVTTAIGKEVVLEVDEELGDTVVEGVVDESPDP